MAQNKGLVNTVELGRAIRRKREELQLSLRDVADETKVSASTLSRIENGTGKPDADNIARLTAWLEMPVERIMSGREQGDESAQAVVYFPQESTPSIVEAHLRADRNLSEETARA
ncbi:MAG: helix-turn-helix domain-containing protein, partial [Pyrinomonadaceae bacterium]